MCGVDCTGSPVAVDPKTGFVVNASSVTSVAGSADFEQHNHHATTAIIVVLAIVVLFGGAVFWQQRRPTQEGSHQLVLPAKAGIAKRVIMTNPIYSTGETDPGYVDIDEAASESTTDAGSVSETYN